MPREDLINDLGALGGLAFYLVMTALVVVALPSENRIGIAIALLAGLLACYALVSLIRMFWFTSRPKQMHYTNWWQQVDAGSFPSLHAMRAAFLATILSILSGFNIAVMLVAALLTLAVGWMRVIKKMHRWVDIIFGIIFGIIIAVVAMVLLVAVPTWL